MTDTAETPLRALQQIARGREDNGRPLAARDAQDLARRALASSCFSWGPSIKSAVRSVPVRDPRGHQIDDLLSLTAMLSEAVDEGWWIRDNQLKYLRLVIDTRANCAWTLMDRDRNIIDIERVEKAIERHRNKHK